MKRSNKIILFLASFVFFSFSTFSKDECKQLKSCADYVGVLTGSKYDLGKFAKKSLRVDPAIKLTNGNADQLFAYILEQNNLFRVTTASGTYRVMDKREFQSFQFPKVEGEFVRYTLDFVSYEYNVKVADLKDMLLAVAKKNVTKNGRVLENVGDNKITLVDNGANINKLVGLFSELDR